MGDPVTKSLCGDSLLIAQSFNLTKQNINF